MGGCWRCLRTGRQEGKRRVLRAGRERALLGSGLVWVVLSAVVQRQQRGNRAHSPLQHHRGVPGSPSRRHEVLRGEGGGRGGGEKEGGPTVAADSNAL